MPTPRETFSQQYSPGQPYKLDGGLLNKQHAVLEGVAMRGGAAFADTTQGQQNPPPPGAIGVATVTDASNTCGTADGEIQPPCSNVNKYWAHFRYYDTNANIWIDYDEDLRIDASGYWEGIASGGGYATNASKQPASGPGYGAIPAFLEGDQVTCFYDSNRGWLVPIASPPDAAPGGEMYSSSVVSVPDEGVDPNNCVILSLDINTPASGTWQPVQQIAIRIPEENLYEWLDSGSVFCIFRAPSTATRGTYVRLRVAKHSDYNVSVWEARLRMFGVGRASSASYKANHNVRKSLEDGKGRWHNSGWIISSSIPGRFKDCPTFTVDAQGLMEVTYLDPQDDWFVAAEAHITVANEPPQISSTSQSSVSSSTYLSYSSLSPSSQSTSSSQSGSSRSSTRSWSSQSSISSSTSGTATSTSSTHLQSTSTSESSTRSGTSETSELGYCTVTLVSDVECDTDGHVIRVCYRTIAIPSLGDGTPCNEQIGPEVCYPCERETSFSSPSWTDQTSTSSTHLKSTSSLTTSLGTSTSGSLTSTRTAVSSTLSLSGTSQGTSSQGTSSLGISSGTSSLGISSLGLSSNTTSANSTRSTFPIDATQMGLSGP